MSGPRSHPRWTFLGAAVPALLLVLLTSRVSTPAEGPPLVKGATAPLFTLRTPAGEEFPLERLRGRVFILSFWDCYADVCFTSVPVFEAIARKYPPDKLTLITICFSVPAALSANNYALLLKNCGMGQVILIDQEHKVRDLYRVETGPTTFLVDGEMTIRDKITGLAGLRSRHFEKLTEDLVSHAGETPAVPAEAADTPDRPDVPASPEDQPAEGSQSPD